MLRMLAEAGVDNSQQGTRKYEEEVFGHPLDPDETYLEWAQRQQRAEEIAEKMQRMRRLHDDEITQITQTEEPAKPIPLPSPPVSAGEDLIREYDREAKKV